MQRQRKTRKSSNKHANKQPTAMRRKSDKNSSRFIALIFNYIGVLFLLLVTFVSAATVTFFTIPELVNKLGFVERKHRLFATYSIGAAFGNYLLARYKDTSLRSHKTSASLPFRAHYCSLCECVVLKHDHHCYLLGRCIGYHNQKYFIWFCWYSTVTAFYCLLQTALYLSLAHHVEFPGAWTYLVLLPRAASGWFTGHTDTIELALTMFLYICLFGGFVSIGFFVWEMFLVITGSTTHEALYGSGKTLKHGKSMCSKWNDVFGKYWYIGMIFPLPLPQYGDGMYKNME